VSRRGAVRFARYAYPPNELGYCGPAGAAALLEGEATAEIERRARGFDGAWVYLELLAEAGGFTDPLAEEVVEAYWVGSALLDLVAPDALVDRLTDRFRGQLGGTWRTASSRACAHHSFQVFEVYPWAGLLRDGRPPGPALDVLDRCRIRTGEVLAVHGEQVTVRSAVLGWDGGALTVHDDVVETARWSSLGRSLIDVPAVGEVVALHWDWVCEVLSTEQAARVRDLEARQRTAAGLGASPPARPVQL
jgi:uncharacterized protein DUF6390